MKDRIAYYVQPQEGQEKILKFRIGDRKEEASCLHKKYFDKENDREKIVGYVHLKNREYSGREYGTVKNAVEDSMDIYSKKKFYQRVVGYIPTTDGEFIAVTKNYLLLLLLFGLLLIGIGIVCWFTLRSTEPDVLVPDFSQVVEEEEDDCTCDITAKVILPEGVVSFDGEIDTPEDEQKKAEDKENGTGGGDYKPYNGTAIVEVIQVVDGEEFKLVEATEVKIKNGELPDVYIDFTTLRFELKPGIYSGFVRITYSDGSVLEKPIRIVIYDKTSGSVGIGYSDQVYVYMAEDRVSLKYECDEATTRTIVQLLIKNGDEEILLAQSGIVNSGDMIKELSLEAEAKAMLRSGAYKGIMRAYFEDSGEELTGLKTDIEVTINVQ